MHPMLIHRAPAFFRSIGLILGLLSAFLGLHAAESTPASPLLGRWDLTVKGPEREYPSWFEVKKSGHKTLVGSYVGQFGSARPISQVVVDGNRFRFTVPPQWEERTTDVVVEGTLTGETVQGTVTDDQGRKLAWTGRRAPKLLRAGEPKWGKPVELFNGKDLTGWKALWANGPHGWVVKDGLLVNAKPGVNLVTTGTFGDFKLHVEFRYPPKSNSGIYLRGRYEAQIEDNHGLEAESHLIGGIYGFLTPSVNAAKPAGEWQSYDITLTGRVVTVVLNGQRVIDRQVIPGITGGAIDSNEAAPGPLYIQGDHGVVEFRKITLTPAH
jgi:hypothetical protein